MKKIIYLAFGLLGINLSCPAFASLSMEDWNQISILTKKEWRQVVDQIKAAGLSTKDGIVKNITDLSTGGAGIIPAAIRNAIRPAGNQNAVLATSALQTQQDLADVNATVLVAPTGVLETDINTVRTSLTAAAVNAPNSSLEERVTTLRDTDLGHNDFDAMHATAAAVSANITNGINTIGGGLNNDADTVTRAQLRILYRWSQGASGDVVHGGAGNLNLGGGATEDDVTLSGFIEALVQRTLQ